ncbi:MAG: glycosyltransferase [Deltaproteobacteria bacterium]|nr:glycosyltransferase [Deltaproteobacteria bacterium]
MVSIIISFYERLEHLRCCLDSLNFSAGDFDEVVITDDGSSDETVIRLKEMIPHYNFTIHHVWQPKNGFWVAAARNNGIRHAKGDYLIFFDSDFLILPDAIKYHLKLAKSGRFVAGNCKYLTEAQTDSVFNSNVSPEFLEKLYQQLPEKEMIKDHRRFIKRTILFRLHLKNRRKQSLGGHFSIFRSDIEYVNGYDENFKGWGGEDEDLGIRLVKAGIYGRSVIRHAKILHMWHSKEIGNKHWKDGPNINYFTRENVDFFCKNGLRKTIP